MTKKTNKSVKFCSKVPSDAEKIAKNHTGKLYCSTLQSFITRQDSSSIKFTSTHYLLREKQEEEDTAGRC